MIIHNLVNTLGEAHSFATTDVGDGDIMAVLEAARLAPSAMNSQIWRFFVVRIEEKRDQLARIAGEPAFLTAPVVIAACAAPYFLTRRGREQPYFMIDVPIAVTHLMLRAVELGLESAWTFEFDEDEALSVICAPERYRAVALVSLGYAKERVMNTDPGESHTVEIR